MDSRHRIVFARHRIVFARRRIVFRIVLARAFGTACLFLTTVAARADAGVTSDFPLYLDPVRVYPPEEIVLGASLAAVEGGLYLVRASDFDVAGFALRPGGEPAYPAPLRLDGTYGTQASPVRVAAVGGAALAAWVMAPGGGEAVVRAALQEPGDWLDRSRPVITLGPGRDPAVAGDGEAGVVLWVAGGGDLAGVRLEAAAWPAAPPPVIVAPGPGLRRPDLAFAPETGVFLAAWRRDPAGVEGRLIGAGGIPSGPIVPIATAPVDSGPAVTWDGSHFIVVVARAGVVEAIRLAADGAPVDPQPIAVAGPNARGAWSGSRAGETLVAWVSGGPWYEPYQVRAARLDTAGTVLDPGGVLLLDGQNTRPIEGTGGLDNQVLAVAWTGDRYEVMWIENHSNCWGDFVFEDLLAAALVPGEPPGVTTARPPFGYGGQGRLAAAPLGDLFWTAGVGGSRETTWGVGARWRPAGARADLLDPEGIQLVWADPCYPQQQYLNGPTVASAGGRVLTAFRFIDMGGYRDECWVTYGIHDAEGRVVGGAEGPWFQRGPWCAAPVVASDGRRFIVAFTGAHRAPWESRLHWFGVDETGTPFGDGEADAGPAERAHAAASNGEGYLVAWSADLGDPGVIVGRFDADFALLEPPATLPAGDGDWTRLRLASDGHGYLAVWRHADTLRAARLTGDGQVLDPAGFAAAVRRGRSDFDLSWDGTHYVLAWIDEDLGDAVVRLRRLAADGEVVDPDPIEGLRAPDGLEACSIASRRRGGLSLVAATRSNGTGHGILFQNPDVAPVELASFTALASPGAVALEWTTGRESGVAGFHVLRSPEPDLARARRATAKLIPAGRRRYAYMDRGLASGPYWYWLEEVTVAGELARYGPVTARVPPAEPGAPSASSSPSALHLGPPTPNPFRASTRIAFTLPERGPASLAIYSVAGQLVRPLLDREVLEAGEHRITWDGRDARGRVLAAGVYLCRLEAGAHTLERKLHLMR